MQLLPAARKACAVAIGKNIRKTKPLALTSPSAPLTWKGGGGRPGFLLPALPAFFPSAFISLSKIREGGPPLDLPQGYQMSISKYGYKHFNSFKNR